MNESLGFVPKSGQEEIIEPLRVFRSPESGKLEADPMVVDAIKKTAKGALALNETERIRNLQQLARYGRGIALTIKAESRDIPNLIEARMLREEIVPILSGVREQTQHRKVEKKGVIMKILSQKPQFETVVVKGGLQGPLVERGIAARALADLYNFIDPASRNLLRAVLDGGLDDETADYVRDRIIKVQS